MYSDNLSSIPEITPQDVLNNIGKMRIIDVRRPDEFNNELGHIETAELITLGEELTHFLENGNRSEKIVFVCRSGGRSGEATKESMNLGYHFTKNMTGGMLAWNKNSFPKKLK